MSLDPGSGQRGIDDGHGLSERLPILPPDRAGAMLTVYGTHGSPGASTTAMHLAAHWASAGREVLLIEADPAGGSLSHNLGIQFTPGSASFVASGLPLLSNHLIDHAQDVLFENLHVMPAPATPAGAAGTFRTFAEAAEELRTISENEMAVIIDGGRITADTAASQLTTEAAGVLVVCRDNSQLSNLEPLKDVLAADPDGDGPQGCTAAVGKSPLNDEEWLGRYGLTFCGAIEVVADMTADLAAFLNRNKRKSKKWRISLEQVAEKLYPYAQPPASDPSRRLRPATRTPTSGAELAGAADQIDPVPAAEAPVPAPPAAPDVEPQPAHLQPPPLHEPEPPPGRSHYLPPERWLDDPQGHGQGPPMAPHYPQTYGQSVPSPPAPGQYPPPAYEPPAPGAYPPDQYPPPSEAYPPEAYPPTQYPPPPAPYPPAPYPPDQYPPPAYEQGPRPYAQPPAQGHAPPVVGAQPGSGTQQPQDELPPTPDIKPSGSFRDWAAKLHGSKAEDQAAQNRGV